MFYGCITDMKVSIVKKKGSNRFVRIRPVQVSRSFRDFGGILRIRTIKWRPYFTRYFSRDLNSVNLRKALTQANVLEENFSIVENPGWLFYQYNGKPLVALNIGDGQFYATSKTLEKYDKGLVEHQAYILVEILCKMGLSSATRGKAKFTPRLVDEDKRRAIKLRNLRKLPLDPISFTHEFL